MQTDNLAEAVTLKRILDLTEYRVASGAKEATNFARVVVVVHRKTPTLYRFRLLARVTNATLISEDDIVLFRGQLIVVH